MTARPLLVTALIAALFSASPALAADNQPTPAMRVLPPPPSAYDAPAPRGLGHDAWVIECRRRLDGINGANPALSPDACQAWWAYFQAGGQPNPVYGYAIPVMVTEQAADCHDEVVTKTVTETVTDQRVRARHVHHDKRVAV
jgi:hypothetical protein